MNIFFLFLGNKGSFLLGFRLVFLFSVLTSGISSCCTISLQTKEAQIDATLPINPSEKDGQRNGQTPRVGKNIKLDKMNCENAFTIIKSGDPAVWNGLPNDCTLEDVRAAFEELIGPGSLRLSNKPTVVYTTKEAVGNIRIWMDADKLKMVEINYRIPLKVKRLELSPPDTKRNIFYRYDNLKDGEWIFAKKGLTLVVSEDNIFRALFYGSTTVEEYTDSYRPSYRQIRKPLIQRESY